MTNEEMAFPNTFEEFINGYSFKDSDEVYTNGSELIPTFRVMQGYEHFEKKIRADEKAKTIDEVIKTLAQNVDTILSDRQYYELLKMKGGTEDEND